MSPLRNLHPFLPLPLFFGVVACVFAGALGPFYLAYRYDPEYAYLLNGLNLALGWAPSHIDHPGTPLQLLWAAVLRVSHPAAAPATLAVQVLTGVESYLAGLRAIFLVGYVGTLIWLGWKVARLTNSRALGWLAQVTPFLLGDNFLLHLRVNPEPFILLLGLALIPRFLEIALSDRSPNTRGLVGLAFLVATGLCLKFTFAPVWLGAFLLLREWPARGRFAALTFLGCLLWTAPIMSQYPRFTSWVWALATREGEYGLGPASVVKPLTYLAGLGSLLRQNPVLTFTVLVSFVTWFLSRREPRSTHPLDPWRRLLVAVTLAQCAQLLMTAKHPQSRYLAPTAVLVTLNWIAVVQIVREQWPDWSARQRSRLPFVVGLAALVLASGLWMRYGSERSAARQRRVLSEITEHQTSGARIYYYGASSPVYALVFGSAFAGLHYSSAIEATLGPSPCRTLFLNNRGGVIYSLRGRIDPRELASVRGPIRLHGDYLSEPERQKLPVSGTLAVLWRFEDETIYELRPAGP